MGIEEVKSLQSVVKQILDSIKEIANNKPATRIKQSSVNTFNNILDQARSIKELEDNFVISKMNPMSIPSGMQGMALRGPQVVDLVTNLAAIQGVLSGYIRELRRGGMEHF